MTDAVGALSRAERTYVLPRSYPLFCAYYFGLTMSDYQAEMVAHSEAHPRSVMLIPAGHSKSSTLGKYNIMRHICWNPNVRIILVMSVFDDAADYCTAIEDELRSNEKLIEDYGTFYNRRDWTSTSFTVAQRQHNNEHSTLEVFGAGGGVPNYSIKGHGCEIIVVDDVVTEETSSSPELRRKQRDWFRMAPQTCPRPMWTIDPRYGLQVPNGVTWPADAPYNPGPHRPKASPYGMVTVCGTRFNPYDLYHDLIEDPSYGYMFLDCWKDKEETKPLWPEFWSNEALHAERESLGMINFNKRYRNDPMDESQVVFRREWLLGSDEYPGCVDRTRSFGELPKDDEGDPLDLFKALGMDPASGVATKWAAWPTFMLLGFPSEGDVHSDTTYIIDAYRAQVGVEWLLDILLDGNPKIPHPGFYARYRYDVAKVEANGFANLMLTHHRVTEAKRAGVYIEPHITGRNKLDPVIGVKSMEQIFRDGLVSIPYRTDHDRKLADEIIDQFVYFSFDRSGRRKSLTDYVMAPLDVETPLWTTAGWKTMGTVEVGDVVATPSGETSPVIARTEVRHERVYRVCFDDMTSLRCSADHRWFVHEVSAGSVRRPPRWMTTAEIADESPGVRRRMVARPRPIELEEKDYQIDPYVLGVWLGDGDSRQGTVFGHEDDLPFVREQFEQVGVETTTQKRHGCFGTRGLRGRLNDIGVLGNKHVPEPYMFGSIEQRLALLQGLMDTDGSVMNGSGRVYFSNTNEALVYSVYCLLQTLGFRPNLQEEASTMGRLPTGRYCFQQPFWRVVFNASSATLCPFRMPRKRDRVCDFVNTKPRNFLTIKGVVPEGEADVRCITVEHDSHQFLAGRYMIPTGNCWFGILAIRSRGNKMKPYVHPSSPFSVKNPYYSHPRSSSPYTARLIQR